MITLILALTAGLGGFALAHFGAGAGWGWGVFWGVLGFASFQGVFSVIVQKRIKRDMEKVQQIMLAGQKKIQEKTRRWQVRPLGSVQEMQGVVMREMEGVVREALAQVETLAKYRPWVMMMDRQIATAKVSLSWMIKDFKTVDQLLPRAFLLDPTLVAIKMARLYMTDGPMDEILKLYRKSARRARYNGNVLPAATLSWIQVRKGDADGAFKTLTAALEKSDNETLKRNRGELMNNRVAHFNNSGLGDQWYALHLEEPHVKMQRPRQVYR